jgi:hypothetical protein
MIASLYKENTDPHSSERCKGLLVNKWLGIQEPLQTIPFGEDSAGSTRQVPSDVELPVSSPTMLGGAVLRDLQKGSTCYLLDACFVRGFRGCFMLALTTSVHNVGKWFPNFIGGKNFIGKISWPRSDSRLRIQDWEQGRKITERAVC